MENNHGRGHDHSHLRGHNRALTVALGISASILAIEILGASLSGSLALLADAGHMLTDIVGLVLALLTSRLMSRPVTDKHTWGLRRLEVLSASAQAILLLAVGTFVIVEAIRRFFEPDHVNPMLMVAFGVVGLLGNAISIFVLSRIEKENLNTKAALLEVINDALGSVAVIVGGVIIWTTGWTAADSVVSLLIGLLILPRSWKLLRETLHVLLEATPANIRLDELRLHILEIPHVKEVHDIHATLVGTGLPVLTAHVIVEDSCFSDGHLIELLPQVQDCFKNHFDVSHSTVQFEPQSHARGEHIVHE
jgi:cobalt-zinc-cadmium efflux system protein